MNIEGKAYRTIWLAQDGWSVEIIDQTRLPHELVVASLKTVGDAARAIKTMQVRGAPLIGATAAYGVCLALRADASDEAVDGAIALLAAQRPTAIPPLRDRRDDIPTLIDHFVEKHRQRSGKRIDRVEAGVTEALGRYDWPGNVRELENTIERAVVLATGHVLTEQSISLLGATSAPTSGLPSTRLHQNLEWVERETIRRALEQANGVKKDAAELMGISQRALSYYLAKYRID